MATMNVSLPSEMKNWIEFQAQHSGRYTNSSDYVRDLIRKDQDANAKIQKMQSIVTEGIESDVGSKSMEELAKIARQSI
jgi:antitoxin ParD1/3/4